MVFEEAAPAKVNLYLRVLGRRPDGYHLLDSVAVFPAIGDRLTAAAADDFSIRYAGPFGAALAADLSASGREDLVLRAARACAEAAGTRAGAALVMAKNLPVASGIGGGSADAAAVLRLLPRLWRVRLPAPDLARLALGLGADVPVCLASRAARMGGIGEAITAAPGLPDFGIVLVNPGATAAVFQGRGGGYSQPARLPAAWPDFTALVAGLAVLGNDLETPAVALCPVIGDVLAGLRARPGCGLARMSGSGATCFGLFPDAPQAARAASALAAMTGWWCWGGGMFAGNIWEGS
jgi:4-diphosphocytidyl-2-C-methyl-D-erythritol kinase